jgi:peptidoglycan/xylan/chitin deacetylase (PgdA/CDA1 family)
MSTLSLTSKRVNGIPVLMYHQISDPAQAGSKLAVRPAAFAGQVRYLSDHGYTTVSAGQLAAALAGPGPELPPNPVVLTFDDGYADFHTEALPRLREHGFTATVFVTTGWVADAGPHAGGTPLGPMLSWSQIGEAAAAGIEIAAHSHTHPELDQLRPGQLDRELTLSKDLLEVRLGTEVPGLAYPFGYSSAAVREAVASAGYRYAYAVANTIVRPGPGDVTPDRPAQSLAQDMLALPRLTVRSSTRPGEFAQLAAGQVPLTFVKDWSLTRGYAVVRRTRAALSGVGTHA